MDEVSKYAIVEWLVEELGYPYDTVYVKPCPGIDSKDIASAWITFYEKQGLVGEGYWTSKPFERVVKEIEDSL